MKITAVTACVNYLDYFKIAYSHNKHEFDEIIVVTDNFDTQTSKFCEYNNIQCIKTNDFYFNSHSFDRGKAINHGFLSIKNPDWVCHIDADTFVPIGFKEQVKNILNDNNLFFGAERVIFQNYEEYCRWTNGEKDDNFESPFGWGFGYFQCFNWNSNIVKNTKDINNLYPSNHNCCESDWKFRSKWGEFVFGTNFAQYHGNIRKLPFKVYNVGAHGKNHNGRKTEKFI